MNHHVRDLTVCPPDRYGFVVQFTRLTDRPAPVWVTTVDTEKHNFRPPVEDIALLKSLGLLERWPIFRCVSYDRLPGILTVGIDVEPTTAPIFVGDFEKSWEYGGWPKVMMALDPNQFDHTYRETPADTPPNEVALLMLDFPTRFDSQNGESIWLSRLPESDPRAASAYEWQHCRWVPGNPFDALVAVVVFMPQSAASAGSLAQASVRRPPRLPTCGGTLTPTPGMPSLQLMARAGESDTELCLIGRITSCLRIGICRP